MSSDLASPEWADRNLREGEARLPLEEPLSLKLRRFIEAKVPELAGRLRVV